MCLEGEKNLPIYDSDGSASSENEQQREMMEKKAFEELEEEYKICLGKMSNRERNENNKK